MDRCRTLKPHQNPMRGWNAKVRNRSADFDLHVSRTRRLSLRYALLSAPLPRAPTADRSLLKQHKTADFSLTIRLTEPFLGVLPDKTRSGKPPNPCLTHDGSLPGSWTIGE